MVWSKHLSFPIGVGRGKDPARMGSATNRLWVLDGQSHWMQPLPPMLTKCYGASAVSTGNHLIVAGGLSDEDPLDIVQVYDGHEWMKAQPLPKACYFIKCALDKDKKWYLAGGVGQGRDVYHTSEAAPAFQKWSGHCN